MDLGDATITTVRAIGGPVLEPIGGTGKQRLLSTEPIIQTVDGYPLYIFGGGDGGYGQTGIHVASTAEAEKVVTDLVTGGATAIKIAAKPARRGCNLTMALSRQFRSLCFRWILQVRL